MLTTDLPGVNLQFPKDITLEWSIPKRTGKIFMDYNMNVRGKTLNSSGSSIDRSRRELPVLKVDAVSDSTTRILYNRNDGRDAVEALGAILGIVGSGLAAHQLR